MITRQISPEILTNGTEVLTLNKKLSNANPNTKHTLQVMSEWTAGEISGGKVIPLAGTITVLAKVDSLNVNSTFQEIGQFNLAAQVPLFIKGTFDELQFIGAGMTLLSSAYVTISSTH